MAKSKPPTKAGPPRKRKYDEVRGVKHVTSDQVEQLVRAAGRIGRHRHRDATMILHAFRHGYRVSELIGLRRDQVNLAEQTVYLKRLKGSKSGTHDLSRREVTAFKKLFKDNDRPALVKKHGRQPWAFLNERGGRLTRSAFFKLLARAGQACDPPIAVHPHMLRHGCGYHLINEGITTRRVQDHLGHRNISVTEKYTELAPGGGKPLWDD
jgi:type 1 fimbriae regulatory protein FimB/type 1 fimbriae regulatory protein FimE